MIKKAVFFSLLCFLGIRSFSQSLDDISTLTNSGKTTEARAAIDKYLANPKNANSAPAWYYKGRIYNSLSRDPSTSRADAYTYKLASYEALQRYQQLDQKDLLLMGEFHRSYLDLYLGLYDIGAQEFNAKNYRAAYNDFLKAQDVENFIESKKYTYDEMKLPILDTSLVMNIASAAFQLQDTATGIKEYRVLTDANIGGNDYKDLYEFLAEYYYGHHDDANYQAILAKGKALYPGDNYWNELQMQNLSQAGDTKALFAAYDQVFSKDPNNYTNTYNYSAELYNYLYGKDAKDPDPQMKAKLTETLKAAIPNEKGIDATFLMVNHLYNDAAEYRSAASLIKSAKPEDVKKKKDLIALSDAQMDEAIGYGDKVINYYKDLPSLTTRQKVDYHSVAEEMSDMYSVKGDAKRSKDYDTIKEGIKF